MKLFDSVLPTAVVRIKNNHASRIPFVLDPIAELRHNQTILRISVAIELCSQKRANGLSLPDFFGD
jgi:hypothetical protein